MSQFYGFHKVILFYHTLNYDCLKMDYYLIHIFNPIILIIFFFLFLSFLFTGCND